MKQTMQEILAHLRNGGLCIVQDDGNREDEGDFVALGASISYQSLNTMISRGRGLVCVPLGTLRGEAFGLAPMVESNRDPHGTAFTVSVDGVGTGTGISVADRLETIRVLASDKPDQLALRRPGHLFPLLGRPGGLAERRGHTEASLALAELAGLSDCAVICEILADDGTMLRGQGLRDLARELGIGLIDLDDIWAWQIRAQEGQVLGMPSTRGARLPLPGGDFSIQAFAEPPESAILSLGDCTDPELGPPLVRIHSECLTGDVFASLRCDCGPQLDLALERIQQEGRGMIFYLRQEGRGIGLHGKIRAYGLQDLGLDTLDANVALGYAPDQRTYAGVGRYLLRQGIRKIRLLSNNPAKQAALVSLGLEVEIIPHWTAPVPENKAYRQCKIDRFGHLESQEAH